MVGALLAESTGNGGPAETQREAQILLGHVLGVSRAWLIAHGDATVPAPIATAFRDLLRRRRAGEPIAYLTGTREFHGLAFAVTPAVLIPRHDTETLLDAALEFLGADEPDRVLDLGTGSGCIAISIATERPRCHVTATDASIAALEIARGNADALGRRVEFLQGSWFAPVRDREFDVVVSNPPYIVAGDPHLRTGDLRFEPSTALVSGVDGLNDIRAIVGAAPGHIRPGGWLVLEHGHDQAAACRDLLQNAGFTDLKSYRDLGGIERVAAGRLLTPKSASR